MTDPYDDLNNLNHARIIDTVTQESIDLVLRPDEDDSLHWYRIDGEKLIPTQVFAEPFDITDDDAFVEALDEAESELILAVNLSLRYELHADWYIPDTKTAKMFRRGCEYVTKEHLDETRMQMFGTTDFFNLSGEA